MKKFITLLLLSFLTLILVLIVRTFTYQFKKIDVYKRQTCDIAKHILAEEEDHEQDLQDYLNDIAKMKESFLKK